MSATGELHFIFKSLGKRGKVGEKWKEYSDNVAFYILQRFSEVSKITSKKCVVFRPYGSAAEDLKCFEANDVGDVDIVIFSNSDDLIIHDELIEYSSKNPMYVRIKGVDHPLLQKCLVEGTNFVATSALKNFHSAIFGHSARRLAKLIIHGFQRTKSSDELSPVLQSTCHFINSPRSPAATLNFAQSLKEPEELPNIYAAQWEWLIHHLCRASGVVDTREKADMLHVSARIANELAMCVTSKRLSFVSKLCSVLEFCCSDRGQNLRARFRDIGRRFQVKRGRTVINGLAGVDVHNHRQRCVTQGNSQEDKSERNERNSSPENEKFPSANPQKGDDDQRCGKELESISTQSAISDIPEISHQFSGEKRESEKVTKVSEGADDNGDRELNKDQTESKTIMEPLAQKDELASTDLSRNPDDTKGDGEKGFEQYIQNRSFDRLFGTVGETKGNPSTEMNIKDGDKVQLNQRVGGMDFVPAFRSRGWPKVATDWIERERKWPSRDIVDRIVQEGFHLVVKPPKNGGNPDCDFRISFSNAEYLLCEEMNDIQRECCRCLKKFHRAYLSTEPKGLVTFHLKSVLLQTIEQTGVEVWTENNRAKCMMMLFGNLLKALRKKDLRHYFVSSYNLFGEDYIDSPDILDSLARKLEHIMRNPLIFAKRLIQNQESEDNGEVQKEERVVTSCAAKHDTVGHGHQDMSGQVEETTPKVSHGDTQSNHTESTREGSIFDYLCDVREIRFSTDETLTDKAFNDAGKSLDPLEMSLIEDLRDIGRNHDNLVEEFSKILDSISDGESNISRCVLHGVQGLVETYKRLTSEEELETEEAVNKRNLDSTDDDLSQVLPSGSGMQFVGRLCNGLKLRPAQPKDIPLD